MENNKKEFIWSDKVFADTKEFCDNILTKETFDNWSNLINPEHESYNPEIYKNMEMLSFDLGKKLYLEVTITNSFMSRMIYSLMYMQSSYAIELTKSDGVSRNKQNEVFGMKMDSIHFSNITSISEQDKQVLFDAQQIISKLTGYKPNNTDNEQQ